MKMLPRYVLEATAFETGVGIDQLKGRIKEQEICYARRIYYHACREFGLSTTKSGECIGRDHTTIVQICKRKRLSDKDRVNLERVKRTACNIASKRRSKLIRDLGNMLEQVQ